MIEKAPKFTSIDNEALLIMQRSEYKDLLDKIDYEYLYWDKVKYITPKSIKKETLWEAVKIRRSASTQTIKLGNYTFRFNITQSMQKMLHEFDITLGANSKHIESRT